MSINSSATNCISVSPLKNISLQILTASLLVITSHTPSQANINTSSVGSRSWTHTSGKQVTYSIIISYTSGY